MTKHSPAVQELLDKLLAEIQKNQPVHPDPDDDGTSFPELRAFAAAAALTDTARCISGEAVFYAPDTEARIPGHIYSEIGVQEFRISHCCEYHFDKDMQEPEEEGD